MSRFGCSYNVDSWSAVAQPKLSVPSMLQATAQAELSTLTAENAALQAQLEQLQGQLGANASASQEAAQLQVCVRGANRRGCAASGWTRALIFPRALGPFLVGNGCASHFFHMKTLYVERLGGILAEENAA